MATPMGRQPDVTRSRDTCCFAWNVGSERGVSFTYGLNGRGFVISWQPAIRSK